MLRGNVEQTYNFPLLLPRYMHAQLQAPQQRARTVQALHQNGMERTLFSLHQRADIVRRRRLIEPGHRSPIARHLIEAPRPISISVDQADYAAATIAAVGVRLLVIRLLVIAGDWAVVAGFRIFAVPLPGLGGGRG